MDELITITNDTDGAPDGHGNRWVMMIEHDEGTFTQVTMGDTEIFQLYAAIEASGIKGHVEEYRWHSREWARKTPAERAEALGEGDDDDGETGYALDDPKHPTYHDRMSAVWDERERG